MRTAFEAWEVGEASIWRLPEQLWPPKETFRGLCVSDYV
jgi:hypothetical protein